LPCRGERSDLGCPVLALLWALVWSQALSWSLTAAPSFPALGRRFPWQELF